MSIELSLIIPALNESERLPSYLDAIRAHFVEGEVDGYEVIVVDDGSTDGLERVVLEVAQGWPELSLLRHAVNLGKGAAVRTGMLAAQGCYVMFADADGATPIMEERRLREAIRHGADMAVGSRQIADTGVTRRRSWLRNLCAKVFIGMVRTVMPVCVQDSQCGFKMFRQEVARRLFKACPVNGYLFDLHILAVAERLGYIITEVPVSWREIPGSKVDLVRDAWRMALGLARLRASVDAACSALLGVPLRRPFWRIHGLRSRSGAVVAKAGADPDRPQSLF